MPTEGRAAGNTFGVPVGCPAIQVREPCDGDVQHPEAALHTGSELGRDLPPERQPPGTAGGVATPVDRQSPKKQRRIQNETRGPTGRLELCKSFELESLLCESCKVGEALLEEGWKQRSADGLTHLPAFRDVQPGHAVKCEQ